jgi:hypothetical protein
MSLFSWMSSCGTARDDERPSLIQTNTGNPQLDEMRQAAAEDVALIESDNKRPGEADPDEV